MVDARFTKWKVPGAAIVQKLVGPPFTDWCDCYGVIQGAPDCGGCGRRAPWASICSAELSLRPSRLCSRDDPCYPCTLKRIHSFLMYCKKTISNVEMPIIVYITLSTRDWARKRFAGRFYLPPTIDRYYITNLRELNSFAIENCAKYLAANFKTLQIKPPQ